MASKRLILNPASTYRYSPLPTDSIRLLRLLPHSDENAPIQCQLFEYVLVSSGKGTHLYEALSYVWGSEEKPRCVSTNEGDLYITENLYAALLRLRDRSLERIIWADAICINQDDDEERASQVKIMAKIYAGASRVNVWLEEATNNHSMVGDASGDVHQALEVISLAADGQPVKFSGDETSRLAVHTLLQRTWFTRIWVLQEVAAARHVLIMSQNMDIDGYAFCTGLNALDLSFEDPEVQSRIRSVTYLIKRAGLRPKHVTTYSDEFSLKIRPFKDLIEIYHNRDATDWRDKIYALLGMSTDVPAGLSPNYNILWKDLFRQVVHSIIGERASVVTWDNRQIAVIRSRGSVVGIVSSVSSAEAEEDTQIATVKICIEKGCQMLWTLKIQTPAKPIKQGDIVCILQGASNPTIARLCEDYCAIVAIAVTPAESVRLEKIPPNWQDDLSQTEASNYETRRSDQPKVLPFNWQVYIRQKTTFPREILFLWDWETREDVNGADYERVLRCRPEHKETETEDQQCEAIRLHNIGLLLNDIERYEEAVEKHLKAMKIDARIDKSISRQLWAVYSDMRIIGIDMNRYSNNKTEWLRAMANTLGQRRGYSEVLEYAAAQIARLSNESGMNQFLRRHRDQVPITAEVIKAAIRNPYFGRGIIRLILDQYKDQAPITEEVMKAAAVDKGAHSWGIIELFLDRCKDQAPITEEVMKAAAENRYIGRSIIKRVLDRCKDQTLITAEVIKAAAGNRSNGWSIIELILNRCKDQAPITEEVMKAAARNESCGSSIIKLILDRCKDQAPITEEMMKTAAGNQFHGKKIIELILDRYKDQAHITEEVMMIAARDWSYGKDMIKLILDRLEDQAPITEEVIQQVTKTWNGGHRELIRQLRRRMLESTSQGPSVG